MSALPVGSVERRRSIGRFALVSSGAVRFLRCAVALAACSGPATLTEAPTPPVVVESPTPLPNLRLPRNFTPISYAATLTIDRSGQPLGRPAAPSGGGLTSPTKKAGHNDRTSSTFDGVMTIAGTVEERSSVLWLHGRHIAVRSAAAWHGSAHVALSATPRGDDLLELRAQTALDRGAWKLVLEYTGDIDSADAAGLFTRTVDGARYFFTQFEPIYARRVFPCIDEPDSKIPWQLTLDLPKDQIAVSNTAIASESVQGDRHRIEFETTKPLPPYLIGFGVGPFEVVSAGTTHSGVPVQIFTLKGRDSGVTYAAATATRLLEQLEAWFGAPFPFPKLDFLVVPEMTEAGAMANAALIAVEQNAIDLEARPSWHRRVGWIRAACRELTQQWFGNLVTPTWWDDLWLNKGFAHWMDAQMTGQFQLDWRAELEALDSRASALSADALLTARKLRQPIEITDDIYNSLDPLGFAKAASLVASFSNYLGHDAFRTAMRTYLADRTGGTATSADFVAAISKLAGLDLGPAFATFLDQPGAPEIAIDLVCGDGSPRVELTQERAIPPKATVAPELKPWIMPVCVAYDNAGQRAEACTIMDSATDSIALQANACPRWVMANARGSGYFYSRYTAAQVVGLRDEAWSQLLPAERLVLVDDVVNAMLYEQDATRLPLHLALSFVPKLVAIGDRFAIRSALSIPQAIERFVDESQRPAFAAWYQASFGPSTRRLGLTPRDSDDLDAEITRGLLVRATAQLGNDPELAKEAVQFAKTWRQLPEGIRGLVLDLATAHDPETFERVRKQLLTESNRNDRALMIHALSQVRDPTRYRAALATVLIPELNLRETQSIVFGATTPPTRALAENFYRAHEAEWDQRLPADASRPSSAIAQLLVSACDAKRRDEIATFLKQFFSSRSGGEQLARQSIERLDQCIASRQMLEPEIRAWLAMPLQAPNPPALRAKAQAR